VAHSSPHFLTTSNVRTKTLFWFNSHAGRAVSLVSLFKAGGAVYCISRNLYAGRAAAALGALCFVALVVQFFSRYFSAVGDGGRRARRAADRVGA